MNAHSLYHGSPKPLEAGLIYEARPRRGEFYDRTDRDGLSVEEFVERFRPENLPSRLRCIFAVSSRRFLNFAGASENFVYSIQPLGRISLCHFDWFSRLLGLVSGGVHLNKSKKAADFARKYWSGEWNASPRHFAGIELWENLCEAIKVIKEV